MGFLGEVLREENIWYIQETARKAGGPEWKKVRIRMVQDEVREGARARPRNAISHSETLYVTAGEMGSPWKVWTEEWQNRRRISTGVEASLQRHGWTSGA